MSGEKPLPQCRHLTCLIVIDGLAVPGQEHLLRVITADFPREMNVSKLLPFVFRVVDCKLNEYLEMNNLELATISFP